MTNVDSGPLLMGLDGGGSKCRACLMNIDGQLLGVGLGGPSNPLHGVEQARASIIQAATRALDEADLGLSSAGNVIVGAGLAGVNLPSLHQQMTEWQHPFKHMYITTDLHVACLGAHAGADGAVIVAGTGSCGYSYVKGTTTSIGGHGFPFGDQCSGAWMGLEAVKAVLLASDGLGAATCLVDLVGDHLQARGVMIVDKMGPAKSSDYAQLARFVFQAAETGDDVAIGIIREGAAYLEALAEKLWQTDPGRMCLMGGLASTIIPWLNPKIAAVLSDPLHPPEHGAVMFARQEYTSQL